MISQPKAPEAMLAGRRVLALASGHNHAWLRRMVDSLIAVLLDLYLRHRRCKRRCMCHLTPKRGCGEFAELRGLRGDRRQSRRAAASLQPPGSLRIVFSNHMRMLPVVTPLGKHATIGLLQHRRNSEPGAIL